MDKALLPQLWRFGLVGVVGFLVNAGLVEIQVRHTGPAWAQIVAFPVAATVTWWLNRRYTFGASVHAAHHEWLRYVLANVAGWLAINGIYFYLIWKYTIFNSDPALALVFGAVFGFILNFAASRIFVFGRENAK